MINIANNSRGLKKLSYRVLSLWSKDISVKAVSFDHRAVRLITLVGIPSAFLLHGYVGFIFGSIKANPWWSSVLIPVVFLFSAIVSGISLVLIIYMFKSMFRGRKINMPCLDRLSEFLLYALIVAFSLELLDFIHRLYQSEESAEIIGQMISSRLFISLIIIQLLFGTVIPLIALVSTRIKPPHTELRKMIYFIAAILIQVGIFSTRWNVVVGGQLFSKSLRGLTIYKVELLGKEGLLMGMALLVAPLFILWGVSRILPAWSDEKPELVEDD